MHQIFPELTCNYSDRFGANERLTNKYVCVATDAATNAPLNANEAPEQVIVAEGQSLSLIALDRGIPLEAMIAANPQLADPTRLFPGDKVNLPKAGSTPAE
ncbi:MAG: LysM peptidoglycan-binding domain-containing protein [Sphingorhabdus sp.]|nr:LysM peptidoglycan-binding domain-containing protein [Sphingorhabdus sp.]